jgi:hypothetical protein
MSMGFNTAMLLLCSYCDPVRTLAHAKNEGYSVVDYRVTDLPFGAYSSEPKVRPIPFHFQSGRCQLCFCGVCHVKNIMHHDAVIARGVQVRS